MNVVDILCNLRKLNVSIKSKHNQLVIHTPRERLTPYWLNLLKERKQEIIHFLQRMQMGENFASIDPVEKKEFYQLSSAQKRLYILQQMNLNSTSYNMPQVMYLEDDLDKDRLEKTFKELTRRHEGFRTSFHMINEEPVQVIHDEVEFHIEYYELKASCLFTTIKHFIQPFDLTKAPLIKVKLITVDSPQKILFIDKHHIITDGVSQEILSHQFNHIYKGEQLLPLRVRYKDFSQWQNSGTQQDIIKQQEAYWLNKFSGELPILHLPYDYPRPPVQSFEGAFADFVLNEEETNVLEKISKDTGTTIYMVILSIYIILLSKVSGQEDIIVGTPTAGRGHVDLERIIGMFVNTLVIRNQVKSDDTFPGLLEKVKLNTLEAFENQDYPFEKLVDNISPGRDTSRNPLFDVMLVLENEFGKSTDDPAKENFYHLIPLENIHNISRFDIIFHAIETNSEINCSLEYCTKLFKRTTIERFINYLKNIIASIAQDSTLTLADIEILTEEEKVEFLKISQGPKTDVDTRQTIHRLFENKVKKIPDKRALLFNCEVCCYGELNKKANQLARVLRTKGVKPDVIVAIMMDRSVEMIVGLLAVLKAGGAYLPMDPEYPDKRIFAVLRDSGVSILLTKEKIKNKFSEKGLNNEIILLDKIPEKFTGYSADNLENVNQGRDLIYLIYTSGSTGRPKGVMLEHKNLVNLINYDLTLANIDCSHILQFSTISFDASAHEIFLALLSGGELTLVDENTRINILELFNVIRKNKIKTVFWPMSFIKTIFSDDGYIRLMPGCIRHIQTAGEQVVINDKLKTYLQEKNVYFHNHYGPSETHVVTAFTLSPGDVHPNLPSIGKPISNTFIYILDKRKKFVPLGVIGELYIGGIQVGRGYWKREALTREKFIENPYIKGERLYKSGDLARWLPDGNIEFIGRSDHQVKIRGFRVELGEIEAQLLNHKEIKECIAAVRTDENRDKYLCAYIVVDREIPTSELREYLSQELPGYMIPAYFVLLEKIPLTPNGKVNRSLLPPPELKPKTGKEYEIPSSPLEEKLAKIWSKVLRIEKESIGIGDNFFELGGHSLKAAVLLAKIHKEFNVRIPLVKIFKAPTIKGFVRYINTAEKSEYISINQAPRKEYYPLSSAQKRIYVLQRLDTKSTSYNISLVECLQGDVSKEKLETIFKKLIERHESLRTSFEIVGEEPVQRIHHEVNFEIQYFDLERDRVEVNVMVEKTINNFIRPFDLSQAPLMRVGLIKTSEKEHILMMDMHHSITDGVSMQILLNEFIALYKGEELKLLRIQHKDFSQWQNKRLESGELKKQEEYWLKVFERKPPTLDLPYDYKRPPVWSNEGKMVTFEIGADMTNAIKKYIRSQDVTLFMLLLAVYNILLAKISGHEDIVVGTAVAGRKHADLQQIIGMFINTLALRNYISSHKTFKEFLREVKKNTLDAFDNQDCQFEDLVDQVVNDRDPGRNPLFDVIFALQSAHMSSGAETDQEIPGLKTLSYKYERNISKVDITFTAVELKDNLLFKVVYSTRLFKKKTIRRMINYYKNILLKILQDSDKKISKIEIRSEKEMERLVNKLKNEKRKLLLEDINAGQDKVGKLGADFDF